MVLNITGIDLQMIENSILPGINSNTSNLLTAPHVQIATMYFHSPIHAGAIADCAEACLHTSKRGAVRLAN